MRAPVALAALSFLATAVIVAYGHITWYGDAHTFPNFAHDFIQGIWNPHLQWRAPGYPVMMILTGVLSGSLAGLIALQALLGALIPLLIYLAVAPTDRVAATIAALAAIGSFVSYQFVLTVYH